MIFPLLVFGRISTKVIDSGLAMGPISWLTCSFNSSSSSGLPVIPAFRDNRKKLTSIIS
jgi:hypothetical protein